MAVASVQRLAKGGRVASISIGSGDGWATPAASNLLVVSANSDATVTAPSGSGTWQTGPSVVDGNGAYVWYKFATGSEATITCAPSISTDIELTAMEYSGVASFDVQNTSTIAGVAGGLATTSVSVTTTGASGLILAFAHLHAANTTAADPTGPTWTGGLTNVLSGGSQLAPLASSANACWSFVGELLDSGAVGSHSQGCSWSTTAYSDKQELVLAFKASASAPGAVPRRPIASRQAINRSSNW